MRDHAPHDSHELWGQLTTSDSWLWTKGAEKAKTEAQKMKKVNLRANLASFLGKPLAASKCTPADAQLFNKEGIMLVLHMGACMVKCQGIEKGCVSECIVMLAHYSKPCADCFGALPGCVGSQCLGECMQVTQGDWQPCALCLSGAVPQCTEDFMSCTGFSDEKRAIASEGLSMQGDQNAILVAKEKVQKEIKGVARTVLEKHFKPLEEKRVAALEAKKTENLKAAKCSDVDQQAFESIGAAAVAIDFGKCMEESCSAPDHKCVSKCVSDDTKLSPTCGECFGDMAYCPQESCSDACSTDPNASKVGCIMCMTQKCFMPFKDCTGFSITQAKALTHELVTAKKLSKLGSMFARFEEAKSMKEKSTHHHSEEEMAKFYAWGCQTLKEKRAFFEEQLEIEDVDKRWKKMSGKIIRAKLRWFDERMSEKKCGEQKSAQETQAEVMHFV